MSNFGIAVIAEIGLILIFTLVFYCLITYPDSDITIYDQEFRDAVDNNKISINNFGALIVNSLNKPIKRQVKRLISIWAVAMANLITMSLNFIYFIGLEIEKLGKYIMQLTFLNNAKILTIIGLVITIAIFIISLIVVILMTKSINKVLKQEAKLISEKHPMYTKI